MQARDTMAVGENTNNWALSISLLSPPYASRISARHNKSHHRRLSHPFPRSIDQRSLFERVKGITPLPRPTRILVKHGGMKPVRKTLEKKRENDEEAWNSKKGYPQRPHYWHGVGLLLELAYRQKYGDIKQR